MDKNDPQLKPYEVAEMLNLHINTVQRLLVAGKIKSYRVCSRGDRRIPLSAVNAYLESVKDYKGRK